MGIEGPASRASRRRLVLAAVGLRRVYWPAGVEPSVIQEDGPTLPLLDSSVLARLRAETDDDDGIWRLFVRNFIDEMQPRIEKLRSTLTSGDATCALTAILSLRTSAQMVGAQLLAELSLELEHAVRSAAAGPDPAGVLPGLAAQYLRRIMHSGQRTREHLEAAIA
ncbi:HPt (histidine-containing phosphotransfer) domain-containing protein [Pseudarthrobacter defluvii]|uniref:HPt (Histidine-containing phosphotransfer) domain-containing protein n=1 Tax=Pseudarthrobacter defluvii TaxID=410837 RepID=A0ABT9UEK4_9MICC|nr:Hpt domain-containing protein [Pseudarthrobacter defluvii]MDQ0118065.1 HPt (histidine-containing phosphotransfer) domain-containing protein [Pseudarthrobacter defluvii]